jgi:uncharacterized protein with FMN-binding domain
VTRAQIVIPSTLAGLLAVLGVQHIAGGRPVAVIVPSAATTGAASTKAGGTAGSRASQQTAEAARTAVGRDVTTQYGDVQLKVTVKGGKIQKVAFVALNAYDGHSLSIDQYAAPLLNQQALAASSAQIQGVSGATYTSDAYRQSLQSALDALGA